MIFDVQISEQADRDLRGIYEYIAFELLAPENAAGQLDRLENAISKLGHISCILYSKRRNKKSDSYSCDVWW